MINKTKKSIEKDILVSIRNSYYIYPVIELDAYSDFQAEYYAIEFHEFCHHLGNLANKKLISRFVFKNSISGDSFELFGSKELGVNKS